MKKLIHIAVFLISTLSLLSQKNDLVVHERPLNNIQVNLLGEGSLFSIDFERQFVLSSSLIISSKIGFGINEEFKICFGRCSATEAYVTAPHHITINHGEGKHFLEFGIGGTYVFGDTHQNYFLYPIIGYRILPLESEKFSFRLFANIPFTGLETDDILFSPVGINLGMSI